MRFALPMLVASLAVGGCVTDFRSQTVLPSDCERRLFFEDQDGDGWGAPDGAFESLCEPNTEASLTARNNLDCDDDDAATTGLTSTLCPANLVTGGSAYLALGVSGREVAAVLPSSGFEHLGDPEATVTDLVWAQSAAQSCGELGWGGGLATFGNLTELTSVTDALDAQMPAGAHYAAWVGLVPSTDADSWVWQGRDGGLNIAEVGFCNADQVPDPADVTDPGRRLALVRRATGRWCFGYPSDANDGADTSQVAYTRRDAYLVCGRDTPQASAFNVDRAPEG